MKRFLLKIYYIILKIKDDITTIYNKVISSIIKPPLVKSIDETLDKVINDICSASRYGDGEFALMCGKDLLFQPYYPELGEKLEEIIKSEKNKHIVCILNIFKSIDWCTEVSKNYWINYLNLNRINI